MNGPAPHRPPVARQERTLDWAAMARHGNALVRLYRPAPCELSYLSWGRRRYGDAPLEPGMHDGWHYFVVLTGNPVLTVQQEEIVTSPGFVSIGEPDCAIGHRGEPGSYCQMLTWIWRTPPSHSALRPAVGSLLRLMLSREQLQRLSRLHQQCRQAVAASDERSVLELHAHRLQIDLCLLDSREKQRSPDSDVRFDLAVQYLRNHLADPQPVHGLSSYLQISKAALHRLFVERSGKSPREFAHAARMEWARDQLQAGRASVKSVAYALGYRHPPDFSRALKQHFGTTATGMREVTSAPDESATAPPR